jgi:death-on-curing protein
MRGVIWPDLSAILDDYAEYFDEIGQELQIARPEDLQAGFDRARTALGYDESLDLASLAALLLDGVATRHALVDGNKRLALMCALTFLERNGAFFDAGEFALFQAVEGVVVGRITVEELAAFLRANIVDPTGATHGKLE